MSLTEQQIERYSRHIILPEVGGRGQEKLLAGRVLIVGAGGLGSPAALYLAAAGVGTLGLADGDGVDLTNLQRQIAHTTADVGRAKVESAAAKCRAINPDVTLRLYPEHLRADNAPAVLKDYDFVIDGTDNFAAKFLVADACHFAGKPYSHAGILRFEGQAMTVIPGQTGCYRCLFRQPPPAGAVPSCSQAGVLGVLAGIMGTVQAAEAVKYLLGIGELLTNRLFVFDALKMTFRLVRFSRNPACPLCGNNPTLTTLQDETPAVCVLAKPRGDATDGRKATGAEKVTLSLSNSVRNDMVRAAFKAAPLEACGLLAGTGGRATKCYALANADASPEHYRMLPEEQFAAVKDMRAAGLKMLAIWHSHPASPARMSAEDMHLAYTPGVAYVILSLADPAGPQIRAFTVQDNIADETPIVIEAQKGEDT